jgi:serine protease Do
VRSKRVGILASVLFAALVVVPAAADELTPIRDGVERALPNETLGPLLAQPPLTFRGIPRGPAVYRERVNGVVLLASTKTVGTGVVVSAQGDIVTNDHVVRDAHKAQGGEWIAVWFKPADSPRPAKDQFLLAKVVQRDARRDLAHLRLAQTMPATASVVPLATAVPDVGQLVFIIGHPKTFLWTFAQGIVSQIRPDYQWRYDDGVARSATAIQTQAAVEPGASGAPLLDDKGAVVGIVVGSAAEAQGVYFAVSVQHVRELLPR